MTIEISVGKSKYIISCKEKEKEKILHLAEKLNQRINKLSLHFRGVDEKTMLVAAALMIEEELERAEDGETRTADGSFEDNDKLNDQDLYDSISETMENISDYIEKLTRKIQNY